MNKLLFTFALLFLPFYINAQSTKDSLHIVDKYKNDTLNFIPFMTHANVIDSISPHKKYVRWELNRDDRRNSRFPKTGVYFPDSVVMSRVSKNKGFYSFCPPNICVWYMAAQQKNMKVTTIDDFKRLKSFLGKLDTVYDAYLWLYFHDQDLSNAKYKAVENGYLIRVDKHYPTDMVFNHIVRSGYETNTYFVGDDGQIVKVSIIYHRTIYRKPPIPIGSIEVKVMKIEVPHDFTSIEVIGSTPFSENYLPTYPGGINEFTKCILRNMIYPEKCREEGIYGRIIVEVSIDENGNVSKAIILRWVDHIMDKEALNVLKNRCTTQWVPAKRDGKAVSSTVVVEILTKLHN